MGLAAAAAVCDSVCAERVSVLQMLHVAGRGVVRQLDGVVLSCPAAGIVRNLMMRLQEPVAGVLLRTRGSGGALGHRMVY